MNLAINIGIRNPHYLFLRLERLTHNLRIFYLFFHELFYAIHLYFLIKQQIHNVLRAAAKQRKQRRKKRNSFETCQHHLTVHPSL